MVDQNTGSLWSHLLGTCMEGTLVGKQLEVIPSLITDWDSWRTSHVATSLAWLPRAAYEYRRQMIVSDIGLGIGLVIGDMARIWDFGHLDEYRVSNDYVGQQSIVVFFDPQTGTAATYSRLVDGRTLAFSFDGEQWSDDETHSNWDMMTGIASSGPMQETQLTRLPGIVSDGAAWATFHPHSTTWRP
jgi:Protein of unknown function (DUF3179)